MLFPRLDSAFIVFFPRKLWKLLSTIRIWFLTIPCSMWRDMLHHIPIVECIDRVSITLPSGTCQLLRAFANLILEFFRVCLT
jgi:hypothetical protein